MANKKITSLTELTATPASGDMIPLVDVDDTTGASTGTTKRVSVDNLISEIAVADMTASAVVLESEGIGSNDNDTSFPTSAAVKDYVDSNVTAQDLDFQGDSGGALAIDLDSESLTIAGGTGISTVGSSNTVTASIDATVATLTGTQTLTNKTLTDALGTFTGDPVDIAYGGSGEATAQLAINALTGASSSVTDDYVLTKNSSDNAVWAISPTGPTGATGTAGATWLTGADDPVSGTGSVGDFYINSTSDEWFEKTDVTTWTSSGDFTGDTGVAGPTGSQGDTGATGSQGSTGATGSQGSTGATGSQGNTGATGSQGDAGDTGATGSQGDTGDTGATGSQGDAGATGATGSQGDTGADGDTAISGTPADNQVAVWTGATTIEGTNSLVFDGDNLGIGTDSIDKSGSGKSTIVTLGGDTSNGATIELVGDHGADNSLGEIRFINDRSTNSDKTGAMITGRRAGNNLNGELRFYTTSASSAEQRMSIASGGDVKILESLGIGITPNAKCHIHDASFWGAATPPALGIQSERPAIVLYDDTETVTNVKGILYDDNKLEFSHSLYTANDWGFDERVIDMVIADDGSV